MKRFRFPHPQAIVRFGAATALGLFAVYRCMPKSWATEAEYPPSKNESLKQIFDHSPQNEFNAVTTNGTVFRIYAPNAIAVRDGVTGPLLVLLVGQGRDHADSRPFKLGQPLRMNVVVRDPIRPDWDRGLFPAVPEKELQEMAGRPALEAYQIFDN